MRDVILIRHGESEGNLDGSGSDTPLTPRGRVQAARLAARFAGVSFALAATSPLSRSRETARLALPDADVVVDARLAEFNPAPDVEFVDVSALTREELHALLTAPKRDDAWETGRDFMARVRAWLADIPTTGTTIAFTHFAVVREILTATLGFRHASTEIAYASLHHLRVDGAEIRILTANDVDHLDA